MVVRRKPTRQMVDVTLKRAQHVQRLHRCGLTVSEIAARTGRSKEEIVEAHRRLGLDINGL